MRRARCSPHHSSGPRRRSAAWFRGVLTPTGRRVAEAPRRPRRRGRRCRCQGPATRPRRPGARP
ncbi:hypothetical protein DVZ84_35125 [Streptomyces parvulus]|uniref:Uncharacterized protein n=1 Tax=Streptomyces parvulus TaxID=146923 RepID=A0A369UV43_9ACTN|nr:hypothetical protein DVZ84_35125 [Streptomyces parvulus]